MGNDNLEFLKELHEHENNTEKAHKILHYNRKRIYDLPQKYNSLKTVLTEDLKQDLLNIISYWLKHKCISYGSHNMVYFLSTHNGTYAVRKKTTKGVTNRRINYLCAIGLLKKIKQVITYGYDQRERRYMRKEQITKVNMNLLRYDTNNLKEPMNTFEIFKYTTEILDECNANAERLLSAKITPGNISYNQLVINGLKDIADEVYHEDRSLSVAKKEQEYKILVECIQFLVEEKGYTTKREIYDNCLVDDTELDKLFKIYKQKLLCWIRYKAPTKEDKEKFNLQTNEWIITLK